MRECLILWVFILASLPSFGAKDQVPLPPEIGAAKTVYLDNQSGYAIVVDYAYRELRKWGRFEIVDSPDKADLVFTFNASDERSVSTGIANGNPVTIAGGSCHASLDVHLKDSSRSLWQDTKRCSFHGASADLIKELKKRMGQ